MMRPGAAAFALLVLVASSGGVARAQTALFPDGDVNADGVLDSADLVLLTRFVTGQATPTTDQLFRADVAPLGKPPSMAHVLNAADLLVLTRALETQDAGQDADGDGVSWADEVAHGTSPFMADSDGDGMSDGVELTPPQSSDPLVPDEDRDGRDGAYDNCPYTPNADQLDRGGVDTATPDGIGDACQCGDVDGNGRVERSADAAAILAYVQAHPSTPSHPFAGGSQDAPPTCDLNGDEVCTLADRLLLLALPAAQIRALTSCADMRHRPLPVNSNAYAEWVPPNYVADLRAFEPSPPAWNETLINSWNNDAGNYFANRAPSAWINSTIDPTAAPGLDPGEPAMPIWQLFDSLDRSTEFGSKEFLEQRGIFGDVDGSMEYNETIHFHPTGARTFFNDHGIARNIQGGCVLTVIEPPIDVDANCVPLTPPDPHVVFLGDYAMNHNAPRWSTVMESEWAQSPLLGNAMSQDNIGGGVRGVGAGEQGRFDRFNVQRFVKWLTQAGRGGNFVGAYGSRPGTAPLVDYVTATSGPNGNPLLLSDLVTAHTDPDQLDWQAAGKRLMEDPILAEYQLFLHAGNLHDLMRYYRTIKRVDQAHGATLQGYDVHGNEGGFNPGSDAYGVVASDYLDSIWWEFGQVSIQRVTGLGISDAWGPLRLEIGNAQSRGRKPAFFYPSNNNSPPGPVTPVEVNPSVVHPRILEMDWAELSAGGGALMEGLGLYELRGRTDVLRRHSSYLALREQNRAVYELKGRQRYADVALVYSVPSQIYTQYRIETDIDPEDNLNGAARALEKQHVPYDVVIFDHEDLTKDRVTLAQLRKYKALVMPSVTDVSPRHACLIRNYLDGTAGSDCANAGASGTAPPGALVVLGELGTHDHLHQKRATTLWNELQSPSRALARPLGTTNGKPDSFGSNYERDEYPQRASDLADFSQAVTNSLGTPTLLKLSSTSGDTTPYQMVWTKTWEHALDPRTAPASVDLVSVHFVRYDLTLARKPDDSIDATAAPTYTRLPPAKVELRLPPAWPTAGLEAWWLAPGAVAANVSSSIASCAGGVCTVTLPVLEPGTANERADLDDYRVLVIGRPGDLAKSNALRRGDRYLLRARYAGERLPAAQQPDFAGIEGERLSSPAQYRIDARAALAQAFQRRVDAYNLAQLGVLTPPADALANGTAFDFGYAQDGTDEHGRTKVNPTRPWGPSGPAFGWIASKDPTPETPEQAWYKGYYDLGPNYPASIDFNAINATIISAPIGPLDPYDSAHYVDNEQYSGKSQTFRVNLSPDDNYRFDLVLSSDANVDAVSGMVRINGRPVELDVPRHFGNVTKHSFVAPVSGGYADVTLGGASGFAIVSLDVARATSSSPAVDPLDANGLRDWWVSPRRANPEWSPLAEMAMTPFQGNCTNDPYVMAGPDRTGWVRPNVSPPGGLPLVDLGPSQHAAIGDVAYAVTDVWRVAPSDEVLSVGASSGAAACLNGELVALVPNSRGVMRDEARAQVHLREGRNVLVLKLDRFWERRWMFYAAMLPLSTP